MRLPNSSNFIPLQEIQNSPISYYLTYPFEKHENFTNRLNEMADLGIEGIYNAGEYQSGKNRLIGIGYQGVVVYAKLKSQIYALKIRRQNANIHSFENEAQCQLAANNLQIGPQLHFWTKNFLLMDFANGLNFIQWIQFSEERYKPKVIGDTLRQMLFQAFKMDQIGLDHGDLSCFGYHIKIHNQTVCVIDFSKGSFMRRPSNVTALCAGLFIGTKIPTYLKPCFDLPEKDTLIKVNQLYKREKSERNFMNILDLLTL